MEQVHGRIVLLGEIVHIHDVERDDRLSSINRRLDRELGHQSILGVPLRRDGRVVGSFILAKVARGGFEEAEISLLESFAEQAVIAIESARARREQREALEQ